MHSNIKSQTIGFVTCLFITFCIGYFVGNDSKKVKKLRAELVDAQHENARLAQRNYGTDQKSIIKSHPAVGLQQKQSVVTPEGRAEQVRKTLDAEWVANSTAARNNDYTALFSELGLTLDQAEHFKQSLTQIHEKAILAGKPVDDLQHFRKQYDDELRSVLGEENYARYRAYESNKQSKQEYEQIREFASSKLNVALDQAQAEKMLNLIQTSRAYTGESWDGPYDPAPRPAFGRQQTTDLLGQQINDLSLRSDALLNMARSNGLQDEQLSAIQAYYQNAVEERQKFLAWANRPEEEILAEKRANAQALLKEGMQRRANGQLGP